MVKTYIKLWFTILMFIYLIIIFSNPITATDYVYLKMNGQNIVDVNQYLNKGQDYDFYGWGSVGITKVVLYIHDTNLYDDGRTASISFTPQEVRTYELDIIGLRDTNQVASQKFYLHVTCDEDWQCGDWSDCVNGQQTRTCVDNNNCGTEQNKPETVKSCESGNNEGEGTGNQGGSGAESGSGATTEQSSQEETQKNCGEKPKTADFFKNCDWSECKESFFELKSEKRRIIIAFPEEKYLTQKPNIQGEITTTPNLQEYNRDKNIELREGDIELAYIEGDEKLFIYIEGDSDKSNEIKQKLKDKLGSDTLQEELANNACSGLYHLVCKIGTTLNEEFNIGCEDYQTYSSYEDYNLVILLIPIAFDGKSHFQTLDEAKKRVEEALSPIFEDCEDKLEVIIPDDNLIKELSEKSDHWLGDGCKTDLIPCEGENNEIKAFIKEFDILESRVNIVDDLQNCVNDFTQLTGQRVDFTLGVMEDGIVLYPSFLARFNAKEVCEALNNKRECISGEAWTTDRVAIAVSKAITHELGHLFYLNEQYEEVLPTVLEKVLCVRCSRSKLSSDIKQHGATQEYITLVNDLCAREFNNNGFGDLDPNYLCDKESTDDNCMNPKSICGQLKDVIPSFAESPPKNSEKVIKFVSIIKRIPKETYLSWMKFVVDVDSFLTTAVFSSSYDDVGPGLGPGVLAFVNPIRSSLGCEYPSCFTGGKLTLISEYNLLIEGNKNYKNNLYTIMSYLHGSGPHLPYYSREELEEIRRFVSCDRKLNIQDLDYCNKAILFFQYFDGVNLNSIKNDFEMGIQVRPLDYCKKFYPEGLKLWHYEIGS